MYKSKSDKTLMNMSKKDLIEQIRILEHNWSCEQQTTKNQYNYGVKLQGKVNFAVQCITAMRDKLKVVENKTELAKQNRIWLDKLLKILR